MHLQSAISGQEVLTRSRRLKSLINEISDPVDKKLLTKNNHENTNKIILELLKPYKKEILLKSLLSVTQFSAWSANEMFASQILNKDKIKDLNSNIFLTISSNAAGRVINKVRHWNSRRLKVKIESEVSQVLSEYVKNHSQSFFEETNSTVLLKSINTVSKTLPQMVDLIFDWAVGFASEIPLAWYRLYNINKYLAGGTILWQLASSTIAWKIAKSDSAGNFEENSIHSKMKKELGDTLSNINVVQAFNGSEFERQRFESFTNQYLDANKKQRNSAIKKELAQEINVSAYQAALLTFTVKKIKSGDNFDILVNAYHSGSKICASLSVGPKITNTFFSLWGQLAESLEKILQPHRITDHPKATKLIVETGEISFENVSFSYNQNKKSEFKGNFTINPGEKVGIVGESGGGKTTLTNLLLRFYDVDQGAISIDKQNIAKVTQESLRGNIAIVSQTTPLFDRTIFENIKYGNRNASDEEIFAAAEKAGIHQFCKGLPKGYETKIGEKGVKLSGGQKQRIAIARAILKNAPILILDEATSALDSVTEKQIQKSLDELMKGKTTIIIAHRLTTLSSVDKIMVVDKGEIKAFANHETVLNNCEIYRNLWNSQM